MATYDNLKTAWDTRIDAQYAYDGDPIAYQTALVHLDLYISALTTEATSISNDVLSYSINGQSVTKRQNGNGATMSNQYLRLLNNYCRGGGCSIDNFNTNF